MRTNYSIKNSITAFVSNGIAFLVAFIAQAIFIKLLGAEYLGINGLFTNILSMLSIFELGIGNAIVYNLYKPIAKKDNKKIASLMNFYKKAYYYIIGLITFFGVCLIPFLKYIVTDVTVDINIYYVYILFLLSTVSSYIMAYRRNLIIANQENYIVNIVHMSYLIILNIIQLLLLYITKNYYLYLITKILCLLLENISLYYIAGKKYKSVFDLKNEKIDKDVEKDIFSRVKALFFHKLATILVISTDNIIISKFFGIVTVGICSNYTTITNAITTLFSQVISALTPSVGNLLVSDNSEKKYIIFDRVRFINSWISIFTSTCILVIVQPFIVVWIGKEYLLSISTVIVITFNFFQKMQRNTYSTFKDSAGIWREDKYVPLLESILNIFFSIVCLKIFGLAGVYLGTIISGLVLWCYSYPKFVYKRLFNRSYFKYCIETIRYILNFVFIALITYMIASLIQIDNFLLKVTINAIICLIIPNLALLLLYNKNPNFIYFKNLFFSLLKKRNKRVEVTTD